jgi:hypothetical protein
VVKHHAGLQNIDLLRKKYTYFFVSYSIFHSIQFHSAALKHFIPSYLQWRRQLLHLGCTEPAGPVCLIPILAHTSQHRLVRIARDPELSVQTKHSSDVTAHDLLRARISTIGSQRNDGRSLQLAVNVTGIHRRRMCIFYGRLPHCVRFLRRAVSDMHKYCKPLDIGDN